MSVQEIDGSKSKIEYFKEDMSNSYTVKEEEKNMNKKKVDKGILYN